MQVTAGKFPSKRFYYRTASNCYSLWGLKIRMFAHQSHPRWPHVYTTFDAIEPELCEMHRYTMHLFFHEIDLLFHSSRRFQWALLRHWGIFSNLLKWHLLRGSTSWEALPCWILAGPYKFILKIYVLIHPTLIYATLESALVHLNLFRPFLFTDNFVGSWDA